MRLSLMIWAATVLLSVASPAVGDDTLGKERFELTPFFGYRLGGHFNGVTDTFEYPLDEATTYGGLADYNLQWDNLKVEVLWSHQKTGFERVLERDSSRFRLSIDHFQAGMAQEVGAERARFSISALVGGSRFASPGLGSELRFSASLGASGKFFASPQVGLRLDARAYAVFVEGSSGAFCSHGACVFAYSGTTFWQGDFTGGLILAF